MSELNTPLWAENQFPRLSNGWSLRDANGRVIAKYLTHKDATLLIAISEDAKRLDWLERFLQLGGSRASTIAVHHSGAEVKQEHFYPDGLWPFPISIGFDVEEERGCYHWEELSGKATRIRQAIDDAIKNEPKRWCEDESKLET